MVYVLQENKLMDGNKIVQMIHKHIDYSIQIKINERTKTEDAEQQKLLPTKYQNIQKCIVK